MLARRRPPAYFSCALYERNVIQFHSIVGLPTLDGSQTTLPIRYEHVMRIRKQELTWSFAPNTG